MKLAKKHGKILSLLLALALLLSVFSSVPFAVSADTTAEEAVPTRPEGNVNFVENITGFGANMWGQNSPITLNAETMGFTLTDTAQYAPFLVSGLNLKASEEMVLSTEIAVTGSLARQDIVFRAAANSCYYALYDFGTSIHIFKYDYSSGTEALVASADREYTRTAGDKFVIRSGNGKVSVWINGDLYFNNVEIDTENYVPTLGLGTVPGGEYSITYANTDFYRADKDPAPVVDEVAPTRPIGNVDYAESITGFGANMWGQASPITWNAGTKGFSLTDTAQYFPFLANGMEIAEGKEVVLATEYTVTGSLARQDIVFRAAANSCYYALYDFGTSIQIFKYDYSSGTEALVASADREYTRTAGDKVVIRSGNGKVSVWINGVQYFNNVAIDTENYWPTFGIGTIPGDGQYTITYANTDIYRTDKDQLPVPTRPVGNINYANNITGMGANMWGQTAAVWSSETKGFTLAGNAQYFPFLADGIALSADKEVVVETEITVDGPLARQDIVFRAAANSCYYALYDFGTSIHIFKYDYSSGTEALVASADREYTRTAGDKFVIRSGNGKVSVWINGDLYFNNVAIDTTYFWPTLGIGTLPGDGQYTITYANTDIYRTDSDPEMNEPVPVMPENNVNYATKINGFTMSKWSDSNNASTWPVNYLNLGNCAIAQTNHFDYGTGLATGNFTIDGTKPYVLEADVTTSAVAGGRVDLIFRAMDIGNYYALYMYANTVHLYKWTYTSGDEFIASTYVPYNRPASGKSHVAILSTDSSVSVWIDGVQYFKDVAIEAGSFAPAVGFGSYGHTENVDSISLTNIKMYLTVTDYDQNYVPESDEYTVSNGVIAYVTAGTSVEIFRNNLTTASAIYTYIILKDGEEVTTGNIGTGMQVRIYADGNPTESVYTIAVRGDLNGDGAISASDLVVLRKYLLGSYDLTGAYLSAADIYETESEPDICTLVWMKKVTLGLVESTAPVHKSTYSEDNFVIGAYVDGYHNSNPTAVFTALKNANINLVLPHNNPINSSAEDYAAILAAAESVGIDYLVDMKSISNGSTLAWRDTEVKSLVEKLNDSSHAYGYYLVDEPTTKYFKQMSVVEKLLHKYDPSAAVLSCLLPSYNEIYKWQDTDISYNEYVDKFIAQAKPQFLASDYYLYTADSSPDLNTSVLWQDMGYLRNKSIETDIPYWHVFQGITDFDLGTTTGMTLAKYSVQMNAALAYGCKGAMYFTANDAFCTPDGTISSFYNDLSNLNTNVGRVGNLIYNATATEIYHPRLADSYTSEYFLSDVANSAIISQFATVSSRNKNTIVSVFEDTDCYYVLVVNKSVEGAAQYEITLKNTYNVYTYNVENDTMSEATSTNKLSGSIAAGDIAVLKIDK